jgi:hypothetical protein
MQSYALLAFSVWSFSFFDVRVVRSRKIIFGSDFLFADLWGCTQTVRLLKEYLSCRSSICENLLQEMSASGSVND